MNAENDTENRISPQPAVQTWAAVGIVAFFVVGTILALPCLCPEGAVKGLYESIFLLVVGARLLYGFIKRKLTVTDYLLWVGSFVAFYVVAEFLH